MDLKQDLNPRQLEAVHHHQGPLLILAGPGSGKTRVLTCRIAYLIQERNVFPSSILAITFTNKAAEEMRFRVRNLLGPEADGMWIGTFHSTCARILRQHIDRLGFERNFVIYDDSDQLRVIRKCLKTRHVSKEECRPAWIQSLLDRGKNRAADPLDLTPREEVRGELLRQILSDYAAEMKAANALDFGDLIVFVLRLFEQNPDLLETWRTRFRHIHVDEYQDTNPAQHALLKTLVLPGGNLCVVGDDDQSIYRWRGAAVENMLFFEKDFPGCRTVTLDQNYRSSGNILNASEAVVRENTDRLEKRLWTAREAGAPLVVRTEESPEREAAFVAREILSLVESGDTGFGDVGVLFRTNVQTRALEEGFPMHGIPFAVIGTFRFYDRAEIKDLAAYLRLLFNRRDSVSFLRVLNRPPRGIGAVTQSRLESYAAELGLPLWDALEQGLESGVWKGAAQQKLAGFRDTLLALQDALVRCRNLASLLKFILDRTGTREFLQNAADRDDRLDNVEGLIATAKNFDQEHPGSELTERLGAFCERIALFSRADTDEKSECVTLMTLHCAKGLEFPVVFLIGMEDGLLPHQRSTLSEESLAEERRLCYVGMTRARDRLYLSRAKNRVIYGERKQSRPSPFLRSIPAETLDDRTEDALPSPGSTRDLWVDPDPVPVYDPAGPSQEFPDLASPADPKHRSEYRVGDLLEHDSLGRGTVRKVERAGNKEKIIVVFSSGKIRKLMANSAPVRKIPS